MKFFIIAIWSNLGRTSHFECDNLGSNPGMAIKYSYYEIRKHMYWFDSLRILLE